MFPSTFSFLVFFPSLCLKVILCTSVSLYWSVLCPSTHNRIVPDALNQRCTQQRYKWNFENHKIQDLTMCVGTWSFISQKWHQISYEMQFCGILLSDDLQHFHFLNLLQRSCFQPQFTRQWAKYRLTGSLGRFAQWHWLYHREALHRTWANQSLVLRVSNVCKPPVSCLMNRHQ